MQTKSKSSTLNQSRHGKRPRTKSLTSTASPSNDAQTSEAVTMIKDGEQSGMSRKPYDSIQQSDIPQETGFCQRSNSAISPEFIPPQPPPKDSPPIPFLPPITALCTAFETKSYPENQVVGLPEKLQSPPFVGTHPTQMAASIRRTEYVPIIPNARAPRQNGTVDQWGAQTYVRSRYIMARSDSLLGQTNGRKE